MKPLLIAHRCGPDIYPEQSIASARHARENGADMVEMDVQYTCDGVPVICHDPNTARIFGVDKLCRDMPLQEFMALRHVSDRSYPSHSLRDVLECFDGPILLHCKVTGEPLKDLVRCITDSHAEGRCVIGVLFAQDAELIKDLCPRIRILAFMPLEAQLDGFLESRAEIIRLWEDWVTQEKVDHVKAAGKDVWIMSGKQTQQGVGYTTQENMRLWIGMGVDGILVNDIPWAKRAVAGTAG